MLPPSAASPGTSVSVAIARALAKCCVAGCALPASVFCVPASLLAEASNAAWGLVVPAASSPQATLSASAVHSSQETSSGSRERQTLSIDPARLRSICMDLPKLIPPLRDALRSARGAARDFTRRGASISRQALQGCAAFCLPVAHGGVAGPAPEGAAEAGGVGIAELGRELIHTLLRLGDATQRMAAAHVVEQRMK